MKKSVFMMFFLGLFSQALAENGPEVYSATEGGEMTPILNQPLGIQVETPPPFEPGKDQVTLKKTSKKANRNSSKKKVSRNNKVKSSPVLEKRIRSLEKKLAKLDSVMIAKNAKIEDESNVSGFIDPYDPIASDQVQSIAGRLRIVEKIILKHGRAYDYRTHTTAQLRGILSGLEQGPSSDRSKN